MFHRISLNCSMVILMATARLFADPPAPNAPAADPADQPVQEQPVFQSDQVNQAIIEYHKQMDSLDTAYKTKLLEMKQKYTKAQDGHRETLIQALEAAKAEAAKNVNLAEANRLQQTIDSVKNNLPVPQVAKQKPNLKATKGDRVKAALPGRWQRTFMFKKVGQWRQGADVDFTIDGNCTLGKWVVTDKGDIKIERAGGLPPIYLTMLNNDRLEGYAQNLHDVMRLVLTRDKTAK